MKPKTIPLGFEVGTGKPVSVPLGHLCVLGQTQLAGKTTALDAMSRVVGRRLTWRRLCGVDGAGFMGLE